MRLTSSRPRRAIRNAMPAPKPPHALLRAIGSAYAALSGQNAREAQQAREQLEHLDIDQRVRKLGEW